MAKNEKELVFTRRVLGPKASDRLQKHLVTQTLRSKPILIGPMPVRLRFPGGGSNALGNVRITSSDRVKWSDLTLEDPHRGGFDDMAELSAALRRAGFRFKPLEEYSFYRIRFAWQGRETVKAR